MISLALTLALAPPQTAPLIPGGDDTATGSIVAEPHCDPSAGEIVICRRIDSEPFRLPKLEPRYREAPVRAARRVGSGELSVEAEQREFPGASSPAAMVRFRIPLGRREKK